MGSISDPFLLMIVIFAGQLVFLVLLIFGWYQLRRRSREMSRERYAHVKPEEGESLQNLINQAKVDQLETLNVMLGEGAYIMEDSLSIKTPIKLHGKGADETTLVAHGDKPALRIEDAENCSVMNMRIEGSISCLNSQLLLENCHIIAKEDGICIEADKGAVVTFSGVMRGDGGIAIRARGDSKVILKPPYAVSGEDYIVKDPRSSIQISEENEDNL